jgi:uncharacterized protein YciI
VTERALDAHTVVLLRRPADAPDRSEEEHEALQERHLAYLKAMREQGALAAAGPFRDQDDETLRGLCLYRTGLEATRALA